MSNTVPERTILRVLQAGIEAISADTSLIDSILAHLPADELAAAKADWARTAPAARLGWPREGTSFPVWAMTLHQEGADQEFVGLGEVLDPDEAARVFLYNDRPVGTWRITVFHHHVDLCVWHYRIAKRILNVGKWKMSASGLDDPQVTGAEIMPDPRYTPDNVFTRDLLVTATWEEAWSDGDALWTAINGAPEARLTTSGEVLVRREDVGGGVDTYEP